MAKKKRGPQAPKGRAKPIGPVTGLARAEQAVSEPVRKHLRYGTNEYGEPVVVASTTSLDNTRFSSKLLALVGGGINLAKVNRDISLTPAQRQPARYSFDGEVKFTDPRQVVDEEAWEQMQTPGTLLVVSGCLIRMSGMPGVPSYELRPNVWDVADPDRHTRGRLALPPEMQLSELPAQV